MLFPSRKDIILPQTAPSGTAAQTVRFLLKQERRRLEALVLKLRVTTAAIVHTGAAWGGLGAIVKEIRVNINDGPAGGGQRNVIQVSGVGCLSYVRQLGLNLDRQTQIGYSSAGTSTAVSTTYEVSFYIPLRHPSFQEPLGNVLCLPLSQTYLANDVFVEVDLWDIAAGGTVFTANPPTYATTQPLLLHTLMREIPDNFPYLRTELRTDTGFGPGSTANVPYEFTAGGFLTGFLVQGFSATLGNAATRSQVLATGGQMRLEYGREVQIRTDENFQQALNDMSAVEVYPDSAASIGTAGTLQNRNFTGESFFDFLSDLPGVDAFSLASCLDLNADALGGDKLRLYFNDLASTTRPIHVTSHRIVSPRGVVLDVVDKLAKAGATA
jgi:hypothetical protein